MHRPIYLPASGGSLRRCLLTVRLLILVACLIACGGQQTCLAQKDALNASIDARADEAWDTAQKIWNWAEPGYQEV